MLVPHAGNMDAYVPYLENIHNIIDLHFAFWQYTHQVTAQPCRWSQHMGLTYSANCYTTFNAGYVPPSIQAIDEEMQRRSRASAKSHSLTAVQGSGSQHRTPTGVPATRPFTLQKGILSQDLWCKTLVGATRRGNSTIYRHMQQAWRMLCHIALLRRLCPPALRL